MDSALVHLAPGSSSTQVTPSFDVQICINDVTVVDDVSVPSDTESCRSTEPVARRRRCSWCPDEADKQRHLSITGRSQSLSSLDGQESDAAGPDDVNDDVDAATTSSVVQAPQAHERLADNDDDKSLQRAGLGCRSRDMTLSVNEQSLSVQDDSSSASCLHPGSESPRRDRSRSVIELVSQPNMTEQLEALRTMKSKEEKPIRRDSVFSRISSYRLKWLNERASKLSSHNTHVFVSVSFSNSTSCDVCAKPLINKPALHCQNCALSVHESSCKAQNTSCPRSLAKTSLSSSQSMKDQRTCSPYAAPLRGTQSLRETASSPVFVVQMISPDEAAANYRPVIGSVAEAAGDEALGLEEVIDTPPVVVGSQLDIFDDICSRLVDLYDEDDMDLLPRDKEPEAWSVTVDIKTLKSMSSKDIKRQDHIWELIQTEKSHYRTLKIMHKVFVRSLLRDVGLSCETVELMFPRLDDLTAVHRCLLRSFINKQRLRHDRSIDDVGELLVKQFGGEMSIQMKEAYAVFCSRHLEAVRIYKDLLKTDRKFQNFIAKCSRNALCKRLGIPECILLVTQRVTKYPLLIHPIIKTTKESNVQERKLLTQSLELIHNILTDINQEVDARQKHERLLEICRRIDAKAFTMHHGDKFKKSDILSNNRRLHHDGHIKWMSARGKPADVLAVVLSDVMFFLSESNQKYTFFAQDNKSSVIPLSKLIVREKADTRDSRGIYLICQSKQSPEMYELVCRSVDDSRAWTTTLKDAIAKCCQQGEYVETTSDSQVDLPDDELAARLSQLIGEIREKDVMVQQSCDAKMKSMIQLSELLSKTRLMPNVVMSHDNSADANFQSPTELLSVISREETRLMELQCGCHGDVTSSDGAQFKSVSRQLGVSLPKRAETFSAFDSKQKPSAFLRRRRGSNVMDSPTNTDSPTSKNRLSVSPEMGRRASMTSVLDSDDNEPVGVFSRGLRRMSATTLDSSSVSRLKQLVTGDTDTRNATHEHHQHHHHHHHHHDPRPQQLPQQSAALARLLQAVHLIAKYALQKETHCESLRVDLTEARKTVSRLNAESESRRGYQHNKQLENLRALQASVQQDKDDVQKARAQHDAEVEKHRDYVAQMTSQMDHWKMEMRTQKDELQRQRDALQRQMELFDEQRRHWITATEQHTNPDSLSRRSISPSTDDRPEVSRVRRSESGSQPPVRHFSPGGQADAVGCRVFPRVGSAGNMAALDGRSVTRVGSLGNLAIKRDNKPLPIHLLSTTNELRRNSGSTTGNPLPTPTYIQQLIPTKLSTNLQKTLRDQRGVALRDQSSVADLEKTASMTVSMETSASPSAAGGHVGSRDPLRAAGATSGNILPWKLAQGLREPLRSSTLPSPRYISHHSSVSLPASFAAAAGEDDGTSKDDSRAVHKDDDHSETKIFYF